MSKQLIYAGIGSRKTPIELLHTMTYVAEQLAERGWMLRSGHADGADKAFERGAIVAGGAKEIHLPWDGYNNTRAGGDYVVPVPTPEMVDIAAKHHPVWDNLSQGVKTMMLRNTTIVLGPQLDTPVNCIVGWTAGGHWSGGTSHAFRVGSTYQIPIFNLALATDRHILSDFIDQFDKRAVA